MNAQPVLKQDMSDMPRQNPFFTTGVAETDPDVFRAIAAERDRQQNQIELIASENIVSRAVLQAQGSVMTNKYAEGYPGKRYYEGCEFVDKTEQLAIARICKLFGCQFANVQPHSGASANIAVYYALCQNDDLVMGLSLDQGGHLTHGSLVNFSGRQSWKGKDGQTENKGYKTLSYGITDEGVIDYDLLEKQAVEAGPRMIIAGASAYPRAFDFKRFRAICDKVAAKTGQPCYLFADVAHYAGLIVAGLYPNPFPHAHVVTTTTHKTLRGPRGGVIMTNDEALAKKLDFSVFPGLQGGPLEHVIAAKAVAFGECLKPEWKMYAQAVLDNAKILGDTLKDAGYDLVTGGTDSHMLLVDLRSKGLFGKEATHALEMAGLTTNKNSVPGDKSPLNPSGLRIGTPAGTTRGFGPAEWKQIGGFIVEVLEGLKASGPEGNGAVEAAVREKVKALCARFPIYDSPIG
ncbi:MAG: serine hydroxymethyltransferase [Rhodospirillales bacterium]|nr:serine hydroxymethyltransferase [Alphaproteobacteria bacterium]MCB9987164.1 serine hydroxymethyltransferase [Rhodospirillales bacterium]USO07972.1 MAG: serine hydroxymethyltransferase [Rhodospirillales bacterium]